MKNKKTSLVSCSPWISIYYSNKKVKKAASLITKATALQVHRALCVYVHHLYTTTTWNDQILLSYLENVNGKAINFIVSVWARMRSPPSPSTFRPCVNETPLRDVHEAAISLQVCSWCCAKLESSPGIESPQLKKGHVPLWNTSNVKWGCFLIGFFSFNFQ